jgi:thiol-disulfide isomerase/thioredoxin
VLRRPLATFAVVLLLAGGLSACGRDVPPVPGTKTVAAPDRGEPLTLAGSTLDGGTLDLADLRGRVVVLNNWASWCAPCRDETPELVRLVEASDPDAVAVVGMDVTDDEAAARAFVEEFRVPYPSIVDPEGDLLATIPGVPPSSLPSTLVLDQQGRVAARIIGGTDAAQLSGIVSGLVAEGTGQPSG